jgi:hypothetical protein
MSSPKSKDDTETAPQLAVTHYTALRSYLGVNSKDIAALEPSSNNPRQSAREKLTRLTESQFQELATDVYDEMNRRLDGKPEGNFELLFFILQWRYSSIPAGPTRVSSEAKSGAAEIGNIIAESVSGLV